MFNFVLGRNKEVPSLEPVEPNCENICDFFFHGKLQFTKLKANHFEADVRKKRFGFSPVKRDEDEMRVWP